jgi:hypothetical protein
MPTYTFSSDESTLNITSVIVMGYDDEHVQSITRKIASFHAQIPISRYHFWEIAPNEYRLKVDLMDGRVWRQEVFFAGPTDTDPFVQHTTNDKWKFFEIIRHNDIRQELVNCRAAHGTTNWDWTPA